MWSGEHELGQERTALQTKGQIFCGEEQQSIGLLNQEPKFQPRRPFSQNHSYRDTMGVEAER